MNVTTKQLIDKTYGIKYCVFVTLENIHQVCDDLSKIADISIVEGNKILAEYHDTHGNVIDIVIYPNSYIVFNRTSIEVYYDLATMTYKYDQFNEKIKIKYFSSEIDKLTYIEGKSDWIDLRSAEEVELKQGEFKLIPLGVAMQLPLGYEAHVVPRSSTFKNFGIIQTNSKGIIDETYCGDNDQWFFPALAMRDTVIHVNDRICQFRIDRHQPMITFDEVKSLDNADRGGHGSTGKQ